MTTNPDQAKGLFDQFRGPGRTRHGSPETSRTAARLNAEHRQGQAQKIYDHLVLCNSAGGATAEEVVLTLGLRMSSASARLADLKAAGLVRDSGQRRRTSSGAYARVLLAVAVNPSGGTPGPHQDAPGAPPDPPAEEVDRWLREQSQQAAAESGPTA